MVTRVAVGEKVRAAKVNELVDIANFTGLVAVIPSSVSGTGVAFDSTTGVITLTAASTMSVNGVFSSAYRNYHIDFDLEVSAAAGLDMRLRTGSDASTNYDNVRRTIVNVTQSIARGPAAAALQIDTIALAGTHTGFVKLYGPAVAAPTEGISDYLVFDSTFTTSSGEGSSKMRHRTATAYTGFSIIPSAAANMTGTIRVYGAQ